jgi:hypothetical protein
MRPSGGSAELRVDAEGSSTMAVMGKPAPIREPMSAWRLTGIGLLRITFGVVWAIDAWFK